MSSISLTRLTENEIQTEFKMYLEKLYPTEEVEDILNNILVMLEEGEAIGIIIEQKINGVLILSIHDDEKLVSIDDIWFTHLVHENMSEELVKQIIQYLSSLHPDYEHEINIDKEYNWLAPDFFHYGYFVKSIHMEKVLPSPSNAMDVYELVKENLKNKGLIQLLLEKDSEFSSSFIENAEEIDHLLAKGWSPVLILVSLTSEETEVMKVYHETDRIIHWDDYTLILTNKDE